MYFTEHIYFSFICIAVSMEGKHKTIPCLTEFAQYDKILLKDLQQKDYIQTQVQNDD